MYKYYEVIGPEILPKMNQNESSCLAIVIASVSTSSGAHQLLLCKNQKNCSHRFEAFVVLH